MLIILQFMLQVCVLLYQMYATANLVHAFEVKYEFSLLRYSLFH